MRPIDFIKSSRTQKRTWLAAAGLAVVLGGCVVPFACGGTDDDVASLNRDVTLAGLPIRRFVQIPKTCSGDKKDLDPFVYDNMQFMANRATGFDGRLVATADGLGRAQYSVRENNNTSVPIAPAGYYSNGAAATTSTTRFVCVTEQSLIDRGAGPLGETYSMDTTKSFPIRCFVNTRGTSVWRTVTVADSLGGEPKDAFWLKSVLAVDNEPNSVYVLGWRDAEYDAGILVAVGRKPREISFTRKVTLANGVVSVTPALSPDGGPADRGFPTLLTTGDFPAGSGIPLGNMQDLGVKCECGYQYDGHGGFVDCTKGDTNPVRKGCPSGNYCGDNRCVSGSDGSSCTPLTVAAACVAEPAGAPCGVRSDGCGGKITCPACSLTGGPGGGPTYCGGMGNPNTCASRPQLETITSLRVAYQDKLFQLCGTFTDPDLPNWNVTMNTDCSLTGGTCVNNLCTPTKVPEGLGVACSCAAGAANRCNPPVVDPSGGLPSPDDNVHLTEPIYDYFDDAGEGGAKDGGATMDGGIDSGGMMDAGGGG